MKDVPHAHILDAYFWRFVDRGEAPIDTPLFTGTHEGSLLAWRIAREFDLTPQAAEAAVEVARNEVAL
jgi:hypothetical protein